MDNIINKFTFEFFKNLNGDFQTSESFKIPVSKIVEFCEKFEALESVADINLILTVKMWMLM